MTSRGAIRTFGSVMKQRVIIIMRRLLMISVLALSPAFSATAQQATFSADDVVGFLVDSVDLGLNRGICIGTAAECAPAKPKGMDMLINFELDSADLTEQAKENLAVFASALKDDRLKRASFVVEGHTDARGGDGYNDTLSNDRATSVQQFLIDQGVSSERLTSLGMGESAPRTGDPLDPENRRVELRIDLN
ncbi:MAG: outer membrane protein OmpA-like peptidoglycan-associated protein [Paracoccaceae bacterium]